MNGRLVYIVGPSGSGKDSVIDYARSRLPAGSNVVFAQRTITRPATAGGENHVAASVPEFGQLLEAGAFAMHWRANDLCYGIGREIFEQLDSGKTVVVSGSRQHLPHARAAFPQLQVVLVTAAFETLKARLAARGREDATGIERRLNRAAALELMAGTDAFVIRNDGRLAEAGEKLLDFLAGRPAPLSPLSLPTP
jgi:ribose 1,5-bisphosphokinase